MHLHNREHMGNRKGNKWTKVNTKGKSFHADFFPFSYIQAKEHNQILTQLYVMLLWVTMTE